MEYSFGCTEGRYTSQSSYYHDGSMTATHQHSPTYPPCHPQGHYAMSSQFQKPAGLPSPSYSSYGHSSSSNGVPTEASGGRWETRLQERRDHPIHQPAPVPAYPLRPAEYPHYRTTSSWSTQPSSSSYSDPYVPRSDSTYPRSEEPGPDQTRYVPAAYDGRSPPAGGSDAGEGDLHPSGRPRKGLWALVDGANNNTGSPGYSIKVLMEYAIKGSPRGKLSLQEIYQAVEERYPVFKTAYGQNWRNSARHDISMDPRFKNVPRGPDEPGKGGLWMFDENAPPKPRKPRKKKVPQEKTASAPVSPDGSPYDMARPRPIRPRDVAPYPQRQRSDHMYIPQGGGMTLPGVDNLFQQSM